MKLTNKQIIEGFPFLNALSMVDAPKIGFRVAKAMTTIRPVLVAFETAQQKIVEKHGDQGEDGKPNVVDGKIALSEEGGKLLMALMDEDTDLDIRPIYVSEIEDVPLSGRLYLALDWFIIEPPTPPAHAPQ